MLLTLGKISVEDSYKQINELWQQLERSYQPFQGGEIRNEDWLFQASESPKSKWRIQDGSTETTYLRWSP